MRHPRQGGLDRVSEVRTHYLAHRLWPPSTALARRHFCASVRSCGPGKTVERQLRERLDALGPAPRAELLHVLMLPDFDRADRIGEFWET